MSDKPNVVEMMKKFRKFSRDALALELAVVVSTSFGFCNFDQVRDGLRETEKHAKENRSLRRAARALKQIHDGTYRKSKKRRKARRPRTTKKDRP